MFLAQERFKSNMELRYQIIVSAKQLRKSLAKCMILIVVFSKFLSKKSIASVESK